MASARAQRRLIAELEKRFGPAVRRAFLADVQGIRGRANVSDLAGLIAAGDIEGALRALGISTAAFRDTETAIERVFEAAGRAFTDIMPRLREPGGLQVQLRFDLRNPRAERILRDRAAGLVTLIADDQREMIREALRTGMQAGANPRGTALDIVGRINRASGRREGGLVGLSRPQADYVRNAESYLRASGPAERRRYFDLTRRDRRFDPTIRKAIDEGRAVPAETVRRARSRYADRLLQTRGEAISRTETLNAIREGQQESFMQAAESGGADTRNVFKEWDSSGDSRTRDTHRQADGQRVRVDQPFIVGGYEMMQPGDSSLGAPASETIQCRCISTYRIDFLAGIR